MIQIINPYLLEIKTKETAEGLIYTCVPKRGVRILPIGYFSTEIGAIEAFYNALVAKNVI